MNIYIVTYTIGDVTEYTEYVVAKDIKKMLDVFGSRHLENCIINIRVVARDAIVQEK